MLRAFRRLAAGAVVLGVAGLAAVGVAGPASAATPSAPSAAVAGRPVAAFGAATGAVGASTVSPQGIDWGNVLRVLGSMTECEALIPIYEIRYFPSAIQCIPYKGGAVMVIVHFSLW